MSPRIRRLVSVDEVRALTPHLSDYVRFVCDDLFRAGAPRFQPDGLLSKTLAHLQDVVPPRGYAFVAEDDGDAVLGMVFLRPSGAGAMEIKRLYVPPAGRGMGVGRALVLAAVAAAQEAGAAVVRLDSTRNLTSALDLYRKLGFVERDAFPESDLAGDPVLGPWAIYMELPLGPQGQSSQR